MGPVYSGMSATDLGVEGWEKPWSGPNGGSCVEAKKLSDGSVAFRQSADPAGPALIYSRSEMESFLEGAKVGMADFLIA
jgi:hypothetical protein